MSTQAIVSQLIAAIPLAMTICAICQATDLTIPCMSCQRLQCEECFSRSADANQSCRACELEKNLGMNEEEEMEEPGSRSGSDSEPEEEPVIAPIPPPPALQLHLEYQLPRDHVAYRPLEYIEPGTILYHPIMRPTQDQWKYAEDMLENYITFTASDSGPSKPIIGFRYLVGRFTHSSRVALVTDYMLSYEMDDHGVYGWMRCVSTYYNMSPMPYDGNIFYPHPLPIGVN